MKITILILIIYFFSFSKLDAQCPCIITHTSGTQNINGTNVTVTSSGIVATSFWCSFVTQPYHIGGNPNNVQGDGSYTFQFSPPVNYVIINGSAMSSVLPTHDELLTFQVNGAFYPITSSLDSNNCDELAIVTSAGHIKPCLDCPGSGFKDLIFPGPISSITVKDSLLMGSPNGSVFSIYIADEITNTKNLFDNISTLEIYPNPMDNTLNIDGLPNSVSELFLVDVLGCRMNVLMNRVGSLATIDVSKLTTGVYFLSFEVNKQIVSKKVVKY